MMTKVWWAFLALFQLVVASPHRGSKVGRSMSCREDTEYPHSNICCLKCDAGQFVQTPCTETGTKGTCENCRYGTFTEHANGLKQCIKCTLCPPDQEIVRPCTYTQDSVCRCKAGRYCHPDEACEICKKCSRCKSGEEIVKNCTSTSNTECRKVQAKSSAASDTTLIVGVAVPVLLLFIALIVLLIYKKKKRRAADSDSLKPDYVSADEPSWTNPTLRHSLVKHKYKPQVKEEMKNLCESNTSSASSSQHNLTVPAAFLSWEEPNTREEEPFPNLVPVNGVESLRECFGFFEELNVDFHKRFFRQLSLNDNVIRSKDQLPYEDRIHDLLTHWVEKEGKDASLNQLLRALLDLNQRRTAERIMDKAIQSGSYTYDCVSVGDVL